MNLRAALQRIPRRRARRSGAAAVGIAMLLAGCAAEPPRTGYPAQWVPSPNFNDRRPNFVVLHHTGDDTLQGSLRVLTDPMREVSAHYVIGRDGTVLQLVDERQRAWHAGLSSWGTTTDLNSASIGIELDNNGKEPFADAQIDALLALLADLKSRYAIPTANFLGHADIAPGRKVDPSGYFPWRRLAEHGFGLWCDPPLPAAPAGFDAALGLQALGYDTTNLEAAIHAFKLRFNPGELDTVLTQRDRDTVFCLLRSRSEGSR